MISPSHDKLGLNIDIEDLSKSTKNKSRKVKKNMLSSYLNPAPFSPSTVIDQDGLVKTSQTLMSIPNENLG